MTQASSTPAPATRLDSLTGLRWIAALMIFFLHIRIESNFFVTNGSVQQVMDSVFAAGHSGVSFFYILSGFVLAWSVRPTDSARRFWRRRFSKIYPLHFVTFLIAGLLLTWRGFDAYDPGRIFLNVTLLQSWVPGTDAAPSSSYWYSFNGVSWSLSCEALFYLSFPLIYAGLRRLRPAAWWVIAGSAALLIMTLPIVMSVYHKSIGWSGYFLLYHLPPVRMIEFVLGMCLALIVRSGRWRGPGMTVSILLVLAGMTVAAYLPNDLYLGLARFSACTVIGYALLIPACALADVRQSRSIWRTPWLVWLGEVSFAFYMVHEMCLYAIRHLFVHDQPHLRAVPGGVLTLATFCMALVSATILHKCVELPMMRLLTRRGRKHSPGHRAPARGFHPERGETPTQPSNSDDPTLQIPLPAVAP